MVEKIIECVLSKTIFHGRLNEVNLFDIVCNHYDRAQALKIGAVRHVANHWLIV